MIPYIKVPDFPIGPVTIGSKTLGPLTLHPFGILVATGVMVGTALATRRARALGYDVRKLNSFITWMLIAGFTGAHVLDQLFYHWDEVLRRPISVIMLWEGLSSFGGFIGALIGVGLWKYFEWIPAGSDGTSRGGRFRIHRPGRSVLPFMDLIMAVFPVAWIFGRSGCSVVHDHLGARTTKDQLLAVWQPIREGDGEIVRLGPLQFIFGNNPRFDLGLLELMFTILLSIFFILTWRRKLPIGTYLVVAAFSYAPVRYVMDFLRNPESEGGDTRYSGFTPAQWCCMALFLTGVGLLVHVLRIRKAGVDLAEQVRVGRAPAVISDATP